MQMSKVKKGIIFIGILVLLWFIATLEMDQVVKALELVSGSSILLLLGLTAVNILVKAWRWQILTWKIAKTRISTLFSFSSIITGVAAGSFIPGRIELAKPLLLKSEHNVPLTKSFSALIIERVLDLLGLLLLLLVGVMYVQQQVISVNIVVAVIGVIVAGITFVIFFPAIFENPLQKMIGYLPVSAALKKKGKEFVHQIIDSFSILTSKAATLLFLALSFLAHGLEVYRLHLLLHILHIDVSIALVAFVFSSAILIGIMSTIPGGIGVTEYSATALLATAAPGAAVGIIKMAVLLDRVISYYSLILAGGIMMIVHGKFKGKS